MRLVSKTCFPIIVLFYIFTISNITYARSIPENAEKNIPPNEQLAGEYLKKARKVMSSKPDSATYYANKAYYNARINNQALVAGNALNVLGFVQFNSGNYENSTNYFKRAIDSFISEELFESVAVSYEWLGHIAFTTSQTNKALKNYVKSMEIYDSLGLGQYEGFAYLNFGLVYLKEENYEKATENLLLAKTLIDKRKIDLTTVRLYNNLGTAALNSDNLSDAEQYFNKGLQIAIELDAPWAETDVLHNLSNLHVAKKNYDMAMADLEKCVEIDSANGNKLGVSKAYINMGDILVKLKQYNEALGLYQKSLDIAKDLNHIDSYEVIYGSMSDIYDSINDPVEAKYYGALQNKIADSIQQLHKPDQTAQLRTMMEFERLETEIELIEKEKRIKELTNYWMLTIIVGGTLCIIILLYFLYHKRKKEKLILAKEHDLIAAKLVQNKLKEEKLNKELNYKIQQLSTHALNIMQKNEALRQLKEKVANIDVSPKNTEKFNQIAGIVKYNLTTNKDWENFRSYFEQINPDFFVKLKEASPNLTANDLRYCSLIKQKYNSREISSLLNLSPNTVKSAKFRITKKLPISSGDQLIEFIQGL